MRSIFDCKCCYNKRSTMEAVDVSERMCPACNRPFENGCLVYVFEHDDNERHPVCEKCCSYFEDIGILPAMCPVCWGDWDVASEVVAVHFQPDLPRGEVIEVVDDDEVVDFLVPPDMIDHEVIDMTDDDDDVVYEPLPDNYFSGGSSN